MTEFELYFTSILDNKVISCDKMKRVSDMLLNRFYSPDEFHFDYDIADKHIQFIEKFCYVPAGNIGQPLKLELFQKARLQAVFGFVDDNNLRQYNEVLIIEGRKNGKTTECAAVETDVLVNDGEGAPEIYNVATKYEQAMKGFTAANNMRLQSPLLKKHLRKRASDIYCKLNMGYMKAMASNTKSLDSLDAHCVIIDELAAIQNRDLYDLMKQSMGARKQPLLFCITTNGFVRDCIFDTQYKYASDLLYGRLSESNKRFLPFIYELDDIKEWDKPEMWIKANPGLGTIKSYDYLKQMVDKAKDDPAFKPTVLVKDFNMKQNTASAWLKWEQLNNEEKIPDYKFRYCIGGMDAADSIDLNAAKAICQKPGDDNLYIKQMYWIPEKVLEKVEQNGIRRERDNAPYQLWVDQGLMRTHPGNKVNKHVFLEWFVELRDIEDIYPLYIGYDPWHISDELLEEFKGEFGPNVMIPVRQGVITLSQPMFDLKADFEAHRIIYNNNPVDKMCLFNTEVRTDINGNIQPVKTTDVRKRIDGTAALLDAYVVWGDKKAEYQSVI